MSFSTNAVVSSVQLEMSSSFAITTIGAVIRLATEAAPTKAEAEANAGHVSLSIDANSPRKFSISQHYGSDFTDGLTLADVLTANTQYKLYLFFETTAIPSETTIEGAALNNDVVVLPFSTATLALAGDAVWDSAWTNNQFVGSLPEWGYSENQKGIFVVYTKINSTFASAQLITRTADDILLQIIGDIAIGFVDPKTGFLFNILKLGGTYPAGDNYYYVIGAGNTKKISGKHFVLDITIDLGSVDLKSPLIRYGNP
ncbi:hypothetical protein P0082_00545 [Candidatus Haliotispira prima]|uniref:Uncharacterized protein n=1 Tax=Candidatus Haliotispira prima TaxID=3034016 RepID=A0ABY8MHK1_9SPIO|nr:hypothetical protein P0082_00545 [Candidatus Haliotispira prima]